MRNNKGLLIVGGVVLALLVLAAVICVNTGMFSQAANTFNGHVATQRATATTTPKAKATVAIPATFTPINAASATPKPTDKPVATATTRPTETLAPTSTDTPVPAATATVTVGDPEKEPDHVFNIDLQKHVQGQPDKNFFAWSQDGVFNKAVFQKTVDGYAVKFSGNSTVWFDPSFPGNWQYMATCNKGGSTHASGSWAPLTNAAAGDGYAIWCEGGGTVWFRFSKGG